MTARRVSCRGLLRVAAAAGLLVTVGTSVKVPAAATGAPRVKTHTVVIEGTSFQPARLTIAAGDTVVWINKASVSPYRDVDIRRLRFRQHRAGEVLEVQVCEER